MNKKVMSIITGIIAVIGITGTIFFNVNSNNEEITTKHVANAEISDNFLGNSSVRVESQACKTVPITHIPNMSGEIEVWYPENVYCNGSTNITIGYSAFTGYSGDNNLEKLNETLKYLYGDNTANTIMGRLNRGEITLYQVKKQYLQISLVKVELITYLYDTGELMGKSDITKEFTDTNGDGAITIMIAQSRKIYCKTTLCRFDGFSEMVIEEPETLVAEIDVIDKKKPTITITPNGAATCKNKKVTITARDTGTSGLSPENEYKYQLSTSNTTVPTGTWNTYENGKEFTIGGNLNGKYYLWVKSVKDKAGNSSSDTEYIVSKEFTFDSQAEIDKIVENIKFASEMQDGYGSFSAECNIPSDGRYTNKNIELKVKISPATMKPKDANIISGNINGIVIELKKINSNEILRRVILESKDLNANSNTEVSVNIDQNCEISYEVSYSRMEKIDNGDDFYTVSMTRVASGNICKIDNIDKTTPTLTISPNGATACKNKKVAVTCADEGVSGLSNNNSYQYQLSTSSTTAPTGTWNTYTSGKEFTIGDNLTGDYYLWVRTIEDKAGNKSSDGDYKVSSKFAFDNQGPTITSVTGNPTNWTKNDVTLTVNATDVVTTNGYSFDGGKTWQTANTKTYTQNTSGIEIKVKDNLGNITTNGEKINITKIDKTGPTLTISPNGAVSSAKQEITITAADTGSGLSSQNSYQYQLGTSNTTAPTGTWNTYTNGTKLTIGEGLNGDYYVWVKTVTDNVGNKSSDKDYTVSSKFTFANQPEDKTPPTITSVTGNPTTWTKNDATLTVNAQDTGSGIATANGYSFDNGSTWQTENTKTYKQNINGIIVKVKDAKGNIASYGQVININKIDKTSPTITISPNGATSSESQKVTITVEDTESGLNSKNIYEYQLGTSSTTPPTGTWIQYTSGTEFTIGSGLTGDYYLWVKAVEDNVGNKSTDNGYTLSGKFVFNTNANNEPIEIKDYTVDGTIIKNVKPNTTLDELKKNITINDIQNTKILGKDGKEIQSTGKITTGSKIQVIVNNETKEYKIVVTGDTDGDGQADLNDILKINKHRLNKAKLENEYLLAGDANKDNQVDLKDILQINKFRLGKIKSL